MGHVSPVTSCVSGNLGKNDASATFRELEFRVFVIDLPMIIDIHIEARAANQVPDQAVVGGIHADKVHRGGFGGGGILGVGVFGSPGIETAQQKGSAVRCLTADLQAEPFTPGADKGRLHGFHHTQPVCVSACFIGVELKPVAGPALNDSLLKGFRFRWIHSWKRGAKILQSGCVLRSQLMAILVEMRRFETVRGCG